MNRHDHDVVIIGAGVSGAALAYVLTRYSGTLSIAILEKEGRAAAINSAASQNSQTLHCGDIETNYTLEKAAEVKRAADMIRRCVTREKSPEILHRMPKMVLGVGEEECAFLRERHARFAGLYPDMQLLDELGVAQAEPETAAGRKELLAAIAVPDSFCAANFGRLTRLFLHRAQAVSSACLLKTGYRVKAIERGHAGWRLVTSQGMYHARYVAVCAGAYSLPLAWKAGLARQYGVLPVAGSFFVAPRRVRGKVYTVQNEKLPFAAVHADPDIVHPDRMRLGPTALVIPFLERRRWVSAYDFLRAMRWSGVMLKTLTGLLRDPVLSAYWVRNLLYELPGLRARLFVREARKILPDIGASSLHYAAALGGLRPQLVDLVAGRLFFGTAVFRSEEGVSFNITPSPGASSCLAQACQEARHIAQFLHMRLDEARIEEELLTA